VVLGTASIDEIYAHCRKHLAAFKCPKPTFPFSDIPRNAAKEVMRSDVLVLWKNRSQ
jgi:hypothetical protein